jgi:hypothetical protein
VGDTAPEREDSAGGQLRRRMLPEPALPGGSPGHVARRSFDLDLPPRVRFIRGVAEEFSIFLPDVGWREGPTVDPAPVQQAPRLEQR